MPPIQAPAWVLITLAVIAVIPGLLGSVVGLLSFWQTVHNTRLTNENTTLTAKIESAVSTVQQTVNGGLHDLRAELVAANREIIELKQAAVLRDLVTPHPPRRDDPQGSK